MNRIKKTFSDLQQRNEKALVGFVTAGDPTPDMSMKIVLGMCRAGLDILELGVPFSDPTADGPVIQRSSERSLENGTSLTSVLEMTRRIRAETPISCGPEIRRSHFPGCLSHLSGYTRSYITYIR